MAQVPDQIRALCKDAQSFGTVTATKDGIVHVPCPAASTVFTGSIDAREATVLGPFRILDKDFLNFQGIASYLSIGNRPTNPIDIPSSGLYAANIEPELRGDFNTAGLFVRVTATSPVTTSSANAQIAGVYTIAQNPADLNPNRSLVGVRGVAYQRSAPGSAAAYGGYFEAFTGGNLGTTNPTPLYAVYATASGGHHGTSPLVIGGRFNVSNLGGGGVGNITEGIAVHALFDGGGRRTNYITAKGLALQGWGSANRGSYTNSYGIYADSSIDQGMSARYFIYSLSTSPSLFSGLIRVTEDVYVTDQTKGIVLKSPDGTCYRFTVANGGALNGGVAITCP